MPVIIFRSRLNPGLEDAYGVRADELFQLGVHMPGFVSIKDFVADDGERVAIAEFDTDEHLAAWRDHPVHRAAQQEGRDRWYSEYSVQICTVQRESRFPR